MVTRAPIRPEIQFEIGETLLLTALDRCTVPAYIAVTVNRVAFPTIEVLSMESGGGAVEQVGLENLVGSVEATLARPNAAYRFTGTLSSRGGRFAVEIGSEILKVQRRDAFRLSLRTNTRIYRRGDPRPADVLIDNLSSGGALISSTDPHDFGALLAIDVPAGAQGDSLRIDAQVIECLPHPDAAGHFQLRLCFDNGDNLRLSSAERDEIARYIFEQQRVMLKVRKLMLAGSGTGRSDAGRQKNARSLAILLAWLRAPSRGWKL